MLFPINRRSTTKEPLRWISLLRDQGVPSEIISAYRRQGQSPHDPTLRAKRAVACLYYVAGVAMSEIEQEMVRFGGGFNAAGAVRSVADRTGDVLGTAARIAEVLHAGLDLVDRAERLLVRLASGVEGSAVDIARHARGLLTRADYKALGHAGMGVSESVMSATDEQLLPLLGNSVEKVAILRAAAIAELRRRDVPRIQPVPLPAYEA